MKSKYTLIFVLVTLGLFLACQIWVRKFKTEIKQISNEYERLAMINKQLDNILIDQLLINGSFISNWNLIDLHGNSILISEINSKSDNIYYLFSEYSCFDCVYKHLDAISKNLSNDINLVLICGFANLKQVVNWADDANLHVDIYLFQDYQQCVFSKYSNFPYLFKITNNLQIVNSYSLSQNGDYINTFLNGLSTY